MRTTRFTVTLLATMVAATTAIAQPAAPTPQAKSPIPLNAAEPNLAADNRPVPARIPTSAFAARPKMTGLRLSPEGLHVAARTQVEGHEQLAVFDLTGKTVPVGVTIPPKMDLVRYFWAGNDWVILSLGQTTPFFDDEAYMTRLMALEVATGKVHFIGGKEEGLKGDDVLWTDPQGKSILLAFQKTVYDWPSVSSIDIATNKATEVVKQRPDTYDWYADNAGVVRYAYAWPDEHHWQMIYRKDATQPFKVVAKGTDKDDDAEDSSEDNAFRISADSEEGFRFGVDKVTGLRGVYRYNFARHEYGQLEFGVPGADVTDATLTEDGKSLAAAWWTDSRDRIKWWAPERQEFQQNLDKAVGEREAWVQSRNRDGSRMVVWVGASNDPGKHYVYQDATGRLSPLVVLNPDLPQASLARSQYVHFAARDGTEIPAYLTLPVGRPAKNLPLIILPHGGPYDVRDNGDFDEDVQFLANRGYVVLQPQYRGSGSYGEAFDKLGSGQWGRAMQDDLDDGMDWLVKLGVADAKRTCIVGSSYGGYAAIWGATRNPERYRCAVSFAGISDVPRQLKYQLGTFSTKQRRDRWRTKVQGDNGFDLKTVSALYNIDRLKVPVLIVHGDKDSTVPPKQSALYAAALQKAGRTYEYQVIPGAGHGFFTTAHAQVWFDKLDAFLAKYNPAD